MVKDFLKSGIEEGRCLCSEDGEIIYANDSFYNILGYSKDEISIKHVDKLDCLIFEDDRNLFINMASYHKENNGVYANVFRVLSKNGYVKTVLITIKNLSDGYGFFELLFYDITKMCEDAFEAKTHLSILMDNMRAGVALIEYMDEPRVLYSNKAFKSFIGRNDVEVNAIDILSQVNKSDVAKMKGLIDKVISTDKPLDYVYSVLTKNGKLCYRHFRGVRVAYEYSNNPVVLSIILDVTELKETQMKLEHKSRELDKVINNVPGAIVAFKVTDGLEMVYANEEMHRMVGEKKHKRYTVTEEQLKELIHPDDVEIVMNEISSCVNKNKVGDCTFRLMRNKEAIWCHAKATLIENINKIPFIFAVIMDINRQKEMEYQMRISQVRFQVAFEQTDDVIWEYDIKNDVLYKSGAAQAFVGENDDKLYDPEKKLIESGRICEESSDDLRMFFKMIKNGEPKGTIILKARNRHKNVEWVKLFYKLVRDEAGKPSRAIGMSKSVDNISELSNAFTQEEDIFRMFSQMSKVSYVKANLTADKVEKILIEVPSGYEMDNIKTWDEIILIEKNRIAVEKDAIQMGYEFSRNNLLRKFINGEDMVVKTYKRLCDDGEIRWISYMTKMLINPQDGDIYLFVYIRDVDMIKAAELSLDKNPEFMQRTGLYTLGTVRDMAKKLIDKSSDNEYCSVFIIEFYKQETIDGINSEVPDQVYTFVSRVIKLLLGGTCIIGDKGDNNLLVFVPRVVSNRWLNSIVKKVLSVIQDKDLGKKKTISYSVGICNEWAGNMDFDKMAEKAKRALIQANERTAVYDDVEKNRYNLPENRNKDSIRLNLFVKCIEHMMNSKVREAAIISVLKEIGEYYQGDRANIIEVDSKNGTISKTYEWCALGVKSLMEENKELSLDKLPSFKKAIDMNAPVVIKDVDFVSSVEEYGLLCDFGIKSLIAVPIIKDKKAAGFMKIDNPANIDEQGDILNSLSYFISNEITIKELYRQQSYLNYHNILTGLLNMESYIKYINGFKTDAVSSLGVVCVDVNGLKVINDEYGNGYGNDLLKFIANSFRNYFAENEVYRLAGDEFIVICENYAYDSFMKKVMAAEDEIQNRYPGAVSIGYTWSDKDINIEKQVYHAEELMMMTKKKYYQNSGKIGINYNSDEINRLINAIHNGEFAIFLQPKADTKTREIKGAEALVRMVSKEKGIIYPDKFIPVFEKQNMVSHIDLFIFEEAIKLLSDWKKRNKRLITISLNFSKKTILERDIVNTMETIFSKYDADRKFIEIEVTESVGNVDVETIKKVCGAITAKGYRVSLDDFGSKYSSMSILTTIKFDAVKMDKSIINDIIENKVNQTFMKNIFSACKDIGMDIVAEGVETEEQFELLGSMGCTYAQGYLFNKAIPCKEFEDKYIKSNDVN